MTTSPTPQAIIVAPARPGVGGLGAAGRDMRYGLEVCGHRVAWCGPPENERLLQALSSRRPLRRWSWLTREAMRRAMRRRMPHDWDLCYAMPGFLPRHARGIRALHQATHHPADVRAAVTEARTVAGGGRGFMTALEQAMLTHELAHADIIRTECQAVSDELVRHGVPAHHIVQSPPGVDIERFRPGPKADHLSVAFVGVLSLWKGVHTLAEMNRTLGAHADLLVIGGPVCPWSRRVAATLTAHHRADVPGTMASAHALVLPSVSDGFGYVVLEAMASGTVPFVTPAAGAAELVRQLHPDLVVPGRDFAHRVPDLLHSLPLHELGCEARAIALRYDRRVMAPQAAERLLRAAHRLAPHASPST